MDSACTHRSVKTYVFVDGNEPAGLWACTDCGHKFVPLDMRMALDAARYQWLRASANLDGPHIYGPDDDCILDGGDADDAVDAAMAAAPDVG